VLTAEAERLADAVTGTGRSTPYWTHQGPAAEREAAEARVAELEDRAHSGRRRGCREVAATWATDGALEAIRS